MYEYQIDLNEAQFYEELNPCGYYVIDKTRFVNDCKCNLDKTRFVDECKCNLDSKRSCTRALYLLTLFVIKQFWFSNEAKKIWLDHLFLHIRHCWNIKDIVEFHIPFRIKNSTLSYSILTFLKKKL